MPYIPERGDLIWLEMDHQEGRRPVCVLSPMPYHEKTGLALICPITPNATGYSFEVPIPTGFSIQGVILADQVRNLDWRGRHAEFILKLPDAVFHDVLEKLGLLLR